MRLRNTLVVGMAVGLLVNAPTSQTIDLQPLSTVFSNPIGVDYHEPTDSLILSANYSSGLPHNLERILFDGAHVPFSSLAGATNELKIATVRSIGNPGGFVVGDLFTGNGQDGQILRITDDGATIQNPWVSLPGSGNGLMRGSLYIDRTGVFGGDLIVCTTAGEVWRITAEGTPTFLTDVNTHLEGLVTVPMDASRFGPIAGTILAGAEAQGLVYSIDVSGSVTTYDFGVDVEDIDFIRPNESFFGINFGTGRLLAASASGFAGLAGDILLTEEFHAQSGLHHLSWDGSAFQVSELTLAPGSFNPGQWEHVTFAPVGIIPFPECAVVPEGPFSVTVGSPVSFLVSGFDAVTTETVTLSATGLPAGAVLNPPLPANGNPIDVTFDWTPAADQVGEHTVVFVASDASGLETACPVTIQVEALPCISLNLQLEDDFATPLQNGQAIDTEFGALLTITGSGDNAGPAILDSTPGGNNGTGQDPDLLVDTGNLLILQNNNNPAVLSQGTAGIFDYPNDDPDGGTLSLSFSTPVLAMSLRLVDADNDGAANLVVLTDASGSTRTYTVPDDWTGDRTLAEPGMGTLDLMSLAPQPGFDSTATAAEDPGFSSSDVVRIDIHLAGSGAVDDLSWCPTGVPAIRAESHAHTGTGSLDETLKSWSPPLIGGSWVSGLDCGDHAPGSAALFVMDAELSGLLTPYGELLVAGRLLHLEILPHHGLPLYFSVPLPYDASLCGIEVFAQGLCTGAPGPRLSNALDVVLGF